MCRLGLCDILGEIPSFVPETFTLGSLGWVWREKVLQEADPEMSAEQQGMGLLWIDGSYDLQSRIAKLGE